MTARTLGTELIDGKEFRWLEVATTSVMEGQADYWEGARLLVDATAYADSQTFVIKHGWIAYSKPDNVFEIPASRNFDELLDARLQLQQQIRSDRVNLIDGLSMLFNANLKPATPISRLRAIISGSVAGLDRTSTPEVRQLRIGRIEGECWKSPQCLLIAWS